MKVLITGFEPFEGETVNPAREAVAALPDTIAGAEIIKVTVPVGFSKTEALLREHIEKHRPDIVLSIGLAGGVSSINVERIAVNIIDARIPDNEGNQPFDEPIFADGDTAYLATVPVKAMVQNMRSHNIPTILSHSAGTYVCNYIMYQVLYLGAKYYPNLKGGFIHVPYLPQQVVDKPDGTPSMSLADIVTGLKAAVEAAVKAEELSVPMGTIQ